MTTTPRRVGGAAIHNAQDAAQALDRPNGTLRSTEGRQRRNKAVFDAAGVDSLLTEKAWQRRVVDVLELHGWRVWHDTTAWRSDAGWPDLVCTHRVHGLLFLELKRESGKVSPAQASWHADLAAAGHPVHVLRPSDWDTAQALAKGASLA